MRIQYLKNAFQICETVNTNAALLKKYAMKKEEKLMV